jgi:hypothetical protein
VSFLDPSIEIRPVLVLAKSTTQHQPITYLNEPTVYLSIFICNDALLHQDCKCCCAACLDSVRLFAGSCSCHCCMRTSYFDTQHLFGSFDDNVSIRYTNPHDALSSNTSIMFTESTFYHLLLYTVQFVPYYRYGRYGT